MVLRNRTRIARDSCPSLLQFQLYWWWSACYTLLIQRFVSPSVPSQILCDLVTMNERSCMPFCSK